eukprot:10737941-Prorocentrum_lima.AAC.1
MDACLSGKSSCDLAWWSRVLASLPNWICHCGKECAGVCAAAWVKTWTRELCEGGVLGMDSSAWAT